MRPILLDTNAYSEFKRGNKETIKIIQHAETIAMTPIVIGELFGGFARGKHNEKNRKELQEFLSSSRIRLYQLNHDTANFYANIYQHLYKKGKPIPTNDMWIAAQALEHGCALCTYDKHFEHINGLIAIRTVTDL